MMNSKKNKESKKRSTLGRKEQKIMRKLKNSKESGKKYTLERKE